MAKITKITLFIFLFTYAFVGFAQNELNSFKYIIVPKQYDFLKRENQYRVNSMTKYLFEQDGYTVFYQGDDYPADLNANPCLAATALVINESNAFTTKLVISLEDCRDKEVFRTVEGKSKIKEFDKTYVDALKKSFVSIQNLNYSFDETSEVNAAVNPVAINTQATEVMESSADTAVEEKVSPQNIDPVSVEKASAEVGVTSGAVIPVVVAVDPKEAPKDDPAKAVVEQPTVVVEEKPEHSNLTGGARAFKNENTTFLLIDQGAQMQAFVSESKNKSYKPGELIGTFKKTSLPNVFRVSWKKPLEGVESTTAYFDDMGNLKIDIERDDKIEVLSFTEVK